VGIISFGWRATDRDEGTEEVPSRPLVGARFLRDFLEKGRPRSTKSQSSIRVTYAINQTNCLFPGDRRGLALRSARALSTSVP
jgi:hypothetical protein